ncbi:MAG: hypothetical protein ACLFWL_07845 [Candidatus Brocadiia bacterium]
MKNGLRPLTIWEILNRSLRLYRRHFLPLFVVSLILGYAGYAANKLSLYTVQSYYDKVAANLQGIKSIDAILLLLLLFGLTAITMAVLLIKYGILSAYVSKAYLGNEMNISKITTGVPFGSVLGSCLLATALICFGLLFFLLPGFILTIVFILVPTVAAIEGKSPIQTLKRSWSMVRISMPGGFFGNNVMKLMIIWIFVAILDLLARGVMTSLTQLAPHVWKMEQVIEAPFGQWSITVLRPSYQVVMGLLGESIQAFFLPFAICALVPLYYDIRVQKEGLDISRSLEILQTDRQAAGTVGGE